MREVKVIKHTTYTYKTSDGSEFETEPRAIEWQKHLNNIEDMCILGSDFKPTKDVGSAIYVYAESKEQAEAFNTIQIESLGYASTLCGVGFYRYDDNSDSYINVETEIQELQRIIDILKGGAKMDGGNAE